MIKNSGYNLRFSLLFGGHLCIIKQRFLERSIERNRNMSASVRSMTGYGRGEHIAEERKFTVEMKSVNHRYNVMTIKLPRSLAGLEDKIKKRIMHEVFRGKTDVYISFETFSAADVEVKLNEALAAAYIEKLKLIEEKFGIYSENKLELAAKFPDVITVEKAQQEEEIIWEALVPALDEAVEKFVAMRTVEGENLKKDILLKGERIRALVAEVKERSPLVVVEYQEKLNNRLKDLLGGVDVDGYEIFRSTKKNSGFGTKPYFETTSTSYTNTKNLKPGKIYYYKVRAFVVINGERVYTDYSLKAYRKL